MANKLLLLILLFISVANASEVVIVQAVSSDKKTLLIRLGMLDGITTNQKAIFTNPNFSFAAKVITLNREYSQWELLEKDGAIPFKPQEIITFDNSNENIYTEMNRLREVIKSEKLEAHKEELIRYTMNDEDYFILRANFSRTLSETSNNVLSSEQPEKNGYQAELLYTTEVVRNLEMVMGPRADREVGFFKKLNLNVTTLRLMVEAGMLYHLPPFGLSKNNLYFGLDAALGRSFTKIGTESKTGTTYILPSVRLGLEMPTEKSRNAFLIESSIETVTMDESFDASTRQQTKVVNAKIAVGMRF